jgi:hypothetical protein
MTDRGLHRREFLQRLGAASALAASGSMAAALACGESRDPLPAAIEGLFDDPEAARAVGAAWLAEQSAPPDYKQLLSALAEDRLDEARALARRDPAALLERLRERHRADFAADRTAEVQGWVLSITEARVCGLLAAAG